MRDKIDAVFANDPALENEYIKISDTEIGNTIASQMMAYMKTNSNGNDRDLEQLLRHGQ